MGEKTSRLLEKMPKVGVPSVIDARLGGIGESLED